MQIGLRSVGPRYGWIVALLLIASGCGVPEYEAKMDAKLKELNLGKPFESLYAMPVTLPDTTVKLRLPGLSADEKKRFKVYNFLSPDPENSEKRISEMRILPGFQLPGYKMTLEGPANPDDPNYSTLAQFSVYLCAIPKKDPNYNDFEKALTNNLKALVSKVDPWREEKVPTPKGTQKTWKVLHAEGKMYFAYVEPVVGNFIAHDEAGVIDFWLYPGDEKEREASPYLALIGWRIPKRFEDKVKIPEMSRLTAGTIEIDPVAE